MYAFVEYVECIGREGGHVYELISLYSFYVFVERLSVY